MLCDNMQGNIGNDVEQEDAYLVEGNAGIVNRIEVFDRNLEPFAVKPIDPVMGEGEKEKPPEQEANIDYGTPEQHVAYNLNCHLAPPYFYVI
jgi:hypothetical protein